MTMLDVRSACMVAVLVAVTRGRGAVAFGQVDVQAGSIDEQCAVGFQALPKASSAKIEFYRAI